MWLDLSIDGLQFMIPPPLQFRASHSEFIGFNKIAPMAFGFAAACIKFAVLDFLPGAANLFGNDIRYPPVETGIFIFRYSFFLSGSIKSNSLLTARQSFCRNYQPVSYKKPPVSNSRHLQVIFQRDRSFSLALSTSPVL